MLLEKLIEDMVSIPALSGHEEKMIKYFSKILQPYSDEVCIDKLGNVIAKIEGSRQNSNKIMIFAHMDQLGLIVRKIEENGFVRVERLGGVPEKVLPGTQVLIQADNQQMINGVIGNKSHHITPANEKYVVDSYLDMYIDIGAQRKEEVLKMGIDVGSPIVYKPVYQKLSENRILATSVDNRVGCATIAKLAEMLSESRPESTVYLVGTVMEEFNLRGAMIAARSIKPDIAICLDLIPTGDTPGTYDRSDITLGKGPVLSMYNFHGRGTLNGTIPHPKLVRMVKETAEQENMQIQKGALTGILTDLSYVQLENEGIPSVDLCFPARYTHTPIEVFDMADVQSLCHLVYAMVQKIPCNLELSRI